LGSADAERFFLFFARRLEVRLILANMPTNNLHSLDALLLSVRDTESKRLTQEAVTAYQAGAYRAAILSIWVAV
jgi:hypothetical protein